MFVMFLCVTSCVVHQCLLTYPDTNYTCKLRITTCTNARFE